ncbi:monovalent cation/H+ antiporter subunit D family protein [Streptomyces sp. 549]|uniref:monovalent cation/H+ antiporter subunit D family protein n=1 Tax=Streptomyces sp. 549 TaxID=3049076 RepID=UPI0024C34F83|nr:monovalent cation/H+ antiporter subunit D family protein [Streptomyces sp. 549]MDK1476591.1 monovalent cation/H+ antiporter subunit D family protein [Streptomyces sp. 549]
MSGALLPLAVAGPLLASGAAIAAGRHRAVVRALVLGTTAAVLVFSGWLLVATSDGSVLTARLGGWPPGIAIVFAADTFSALMLAVTSLTTLACLAFAAVAGDDRHPLYGPLALVLTTGVYGAFLTADLFNLFVLIEVMLVPSYALLTLTGGRRRVPAGRLYLVYNLLASTVFLGGLAMLYGAAGTVNLGELAGAAQDSPQVALAGAVVLVAMAAKASVVPLHGWLPRTYPEASPAITALFSGLLSKVGLYVIIRIYSVLYDGDQRFLWVLTAAALVTMVVGVLGAVGEQGMRSVLSFHIVSQIGYVLLGLALFTHAGLTAAVFYLVQYILVKAALLLCAGVVETTYGSGRLKDVGGLSSREPLLTAVFVVAALSLAGLPPLSGFVAKFTLIRAAALDGAYLAVGVATVVSLLTLLSMTKIWSMVFAGPTVLPATAATTTAGSGSGDGGGSRGGDGGGGGPAGGGRDDGPRARTVLVLPAAFLALFSVLLGIGAEPLLTWADTAGAGLVDPSGWVREVTGR